MLYPERQIKSAINRLNDKIKALKNNNKDMYNKYVKGKEETVSQAIVQNLDREKSFIKGIEYARDKISLLLSEEV
tara:strand:+ start:621 stop:845 length:225 start_codon:yes stop_codon:yes gene_type:complete